MADKLDTYRGKRHKGKTPEPIPEAVATDGDELRFTNKNRRSNIEVSHLLKVVMRVQRGDDEHVDPKTGKRKLFDIVVQTPVIILSVCRPFV